MREKETRRRKLTKGGIVVIIAISLTIILSVIAYLVLTADARNYDSAMKLFENENYQEALYKFIEIGDYKDSEEMIEKCEYELTVGGRFMRSLSKGLEARWEESNAQEVPGKYL